MSVDDCLDEFSRCEPTFSTDAGRQAGCATRFASCALDDPLDFQPGMDELASCEGDALKL